MSSKANPVVSTKEHVEWPYWPQHGAQTEMWESLAPEGAVSVIGFGGPRGGGKSYGARGFAATACTTMPLSVCIVRKTFEDVKKNHVIPMMEQELKRFADEGVIVYNAQDKIARFKNTGAQIVFTYCRNDEDLKHFQGQQYDIIIIEEAGQFTEDQITYMMSSNRSSPKQLEYVRKGGKHYRPKTLMTFNWGGPGHKYLRRVFWEGQYVPHVNKPARLEVYTEFEKPENFKFIFAPMDQNKALMEQDTEYKSKLMLLPEKLRRAYIDGDPDAFTGTMFNVLSLVHEVEGFEIPTHWNIFGALDPGTGDFCSFGLYAKNPAGRVYKLFNYYIKGKDPIYHRDTIKERIETCKWTKGRMPTYITAGKDAFFRQNKLGIQAHDTTWDDLFRDHGMYLTPCNNARVSGAMAVQTALAYQFDPETDTIIRQPLIKFFKGENKPTIEELQSLEANPNNVEDVAQGPGIPDHAYDETRYAIMSAVRPGEVSDEDTDPLHSYNNDCYVTEQLKHQNVINPDDVKGDWSERY